MTMFHGCYSAIVTDVTEDMGQWTWGKDDLSSLKSKGKEFKKMVEEAIDEHRDSVLCTLKYYLLDHIVEGIQRFGALSFLDSSLYRVGV